MAGNHEDLTASGVGSRLTTASQLLFPARNPTGTAQASSSSSSLSPTSTSSPENPSGSLGAPSSSVPPTLASWENLASARHPSLSEHLCDNLGPAFHLLLNTFIRMTNIKEQSCDPTVAREISTLINGLKHITFESLGEPVAKEDPELDVYFQNPMELPKPGPAGDGIMPGLGPTRELEEILRNAAPLFALASLKAQNIPEKVQVDIAVMNEFLDFSFILQSVSGQFELAWKHVCELRWKGVLEGEGSVPTAEVVLPAGLVRELSVALDQVKAAFIGLIEVVDVEALKIPEDQDDGGYKQDAVRSSGILAIVLNLFGRSPLVKDQACSSLVAAAALPLDAESYRRKMEKVLDFSFRAVCWVGQRMEKSKTSNGAISIICERLKKAAFPLWVLREFMRRLVI